MLQGNIIDLGSFDECIAIQGQFDNVEIHGQHCMYTFDIGSIEDLNVSPTFSICVPTSCTSDDVKIFMNNTINQIEQLKDLEIRIKSVTCKKINEEIWNLEFIISR
jgi:hypothetical protein